MIEILLILSQQRLRSELKSIRNLLVVGWQLEGEESVLSLLSRSLP